MLSVTLEDGNSLLKVGDPDLPLPVQDPSSPFTENLRVMHILYLSPQLLNVGQ